MFSSSSFTSSFRFKPFISLPPFLSFVCFNASFLFVLLFLSFQLVHFIASVLSLQLFPSIRYFLPFVSTLFHPFRYSSLPCQLFPSVSYTACLSLQLSSSVHYFLPIVSTLPSCSFKLGGIRPSSSGGNSSSGNSSSEFVFGEFVFGAHFVFGAQFVFVEFVFAIRLPSSFSGGHSSSQFVFTEDSSSGGNWSSGNSSTGGNSSFIIKKLKRFHYSHNIFIQIIYIWIIKTYFLKILFQYQKILYIIHFINIYLNIYLNLFYFIICI